MSPTVFVCEEPYTIKNRSVRRIWSGAARGAGKSSFMQTPPFWGSNLPLILFQLTQRSKPFSIAVHLGGLSRPMRKLMGNSNHMYWVLSRMMWPVIVLSAFISNTGEYSAQAQVALCTFPSDQYRSFFAAFANTVI
jgi:hypothetical protein